TNAFSTLGSQVVYLEFEQICKIEYFDDAYIEVSNNNGATWTIINPALYLGSGVYFLDGFNEASYPIDWAANFTTTPTNAWWKNEKFNISSLASNSAQVKIRFVLMDDGTGPVGRYGWLLDDIRVWKPSAQEASAENYYLPYSLPSGCGLTNETVQLTIANNGATNINGNITASFQREGLTAVTENVPGIIVPGDSLVYTFTNKINLSSTQDTSYEIKVWVDLLNDPNQTNDTLVDSVMSKIALADPTFVSPSIPYGTSVTLTASHTDSITWSSDPLGANIIQYGSSYTTPLLFDTTIYYVQAGASSGGAFLITEVCHFKTTTGAPSGGWPSYLVTDDYIEITGVPNSSLGGFVLEQWNTALANTYTFPQGTTLSPNGTAIIAVGQIGASTPSPANFYYHGATTVTWSSSTAAGRIIKDPAGNIVDAVGVNGFVFPAAANVSAADWSSSPTGGVSTCGFRLTGIDNNTGSNWVVSSATNQQNPNTLNSGVILPSPSGCPSRVVPDTVSVSGMPIYNAGIESFVSPVGAQTQGAIVPVVVNLKNFSGDTLNKVTINYSVNGVLRTPVVWTGSLAYNQITPVTIGTDTFNGGAYTFRAWTTLPNDSADQYTPNDSAMVMAYVCLAGTFTLGTSSSDFPDFASLQTILANVGVCGPTTIKIMPGTYTQQLNFQNIIGLSDTSGLVFESFSGLNNDVIIQYAATSTTNNYVVKFDNIGYISLKNLTIKAIGASYAYGVHFTNGSHHNTLDGNIINSSLTTSSNGRAVVLYAGAVNSYNTISNNDISGGYYSMYIYGLNTTTKGVGNQIIGNNIHDYYYYGMMSYYQDSITIEDNYIHNGLNAQYYGIYSYYNSNGTRIIGNIIDCSPTNYSYALYLYGLNYNVTGADTCIVANNMVSVTSGTGNIYALYLNNCFNTKLLYNSINVTAGLTSSRSIYQSSGAGLILKNNNVVNTGGGYAYYINTPTAIIESDYNNYYSSGSFLGHWGSDFTNLAALQLTAGMDSNSVSINPTFFAPNDLRLMTTSLSSKATPLTEITDDIFGTPRSNTPTIGAHEVPLLGIDVGIANIITPTSSSTISEGDVVPLKVRVQNYGTDTITSIPINYSVNNGTPISVTYTGQLLPSATDTITLSTYISPAGITDICAYTVLANDSNYFNDSTCMSYYAIPLYDAALARIIPFDEGCGIGIDTVKVVIDNVGTLAINSSYTMSYKFLGGSTVVNETVSTLIPVNDSIQYSFSTLVDFTTTMDTVYTLIAWVTLNTDFVKYNDTADVEIESLVIPNPPIVNDTAIPYGTLVTLVATSPDSVTWYQYDTSTVELATGYNYTTPTLFDTVTYWVEALSGPSSASVGAGVNIAPLAVANASTCNTGACSTLNDLIYGTCGSQLMWISTSSPPSLTPGVNYIDFVWPIPYSMDKITIHHAQTNARFLTGATLQYWSGSAWVSFYTFSNLPLQCINDVLFPAPITTTQLRITSFQMTGPGQTSNPNFREIEVSAAAAPGCSSNRVPVLVSVGPIPPYELAVSDIIVKEGCAVYQEAVSIEVYNQGLDTLKGGATASYRIDAGAYVTTETIPDTIAPNDTIIYTFNALANMTAPLTGDTMFDIKAWVAVALDSYQMNDTLVRDSITSLQTPPAPTVTTPVNILYGATATLNAASFSQIEWFAQDTSSVLLDTGTTYITDPLYDTTIFWAQAGSASGPPASLYTGTQSSIYTSSQTRGYHFTAPVDMVITELMVPITVTNGNQYIQVVKFSTYPIVYPGGTPFTTLAMITNAPFGVPQQVSIQIMAGDQIGIIGATNSSGTTMHNSYGSPQVASSIGGMPVTLTRLVYQSPLVSGPAATGSLGLEVAANIARIEVTYQVGSAGCASLRTPILVNTSPPPPRDVGMYSVVNPGASTPSATSTPVTVRIKNFGSDTLTSTTVTYQLNGVTKASYNWTGSVAFGDTSAPFVVYTDTFAGGMHGMKFYVTGANGSTQAVNYNDTLTHYFSACLNGTYTVGDTTSDFATIGDALTALDSAGICGHVIFNIQPGTYTLQMALMPISNMDTANTVTFQSITGDSSDVIIQATPAAATTNYTIIFYGGDYYTLKDLTIKSFGTFGHTIVYYNNSSYNTIENCVIEAPVGASSNLTPIYDYSTSTGKFNTVRNSWIKNGYYGVYLRGVTTTSRDVGFVFDNNIIENFYYYGIYSYYQDSLIINNNIIRDGNGSYIYPRAIYSYYVSGASEYVANEITLNPSSYAYGMYMYQNTASTANKGLVANNMISINGGTGSNYGIYSGTSSNFNFYNNSINLVGGGVSSRGLYTSGGSNLKLINNIFAVDGPGYAYYISTPTAIVSTDYNDLYTKGNYLAYWTGNRTTLAILKVASGKEAHSLNVNPMFYASDNLHSGSVDLNGAAYPLPEVPRDFDGELRDTINPDIGADEFTPPPNDASMIALDAPTAPVTIGSNPVKVTMRNFGADTLISANIAWQVNAVTQTPYAWSGSLPTGSYADSINIGSYNFGAGATSLKFWPENPNGGVDGNHLNDTLEVTLIGCAGALRGTYTIGGTTADYPNFASAVMAIQFCGVDSHVVFNVNPGAYNEQLHLVPIPGASDTATITFQSSTADSTDVSLSYIPSGVNNYVVYLNGADYINFANMTIEGSGTSGYAVKVDNGSNHNSFRNCIIKVPYSTSSLVSAIRSDGSNDNYNTFAYNEISGGYYCIYWRGASTASFDKGSMFSHNIIKDFYYYGAYMYGQDSIIFNDNYVSEGSSAVGYYPTYFYYCDNYLEIANNEFDFSPTNYSYGVRVYYCDANTNTRGRIFNNTISISTGSGASYGLYIYYSSNMDIMFNSVNISSGSSASRAAYIYNGSNHTLYNNNFVSVGYSIYTYGSSIFSSDHNNFYTGASGINAYWNGSTYTSLSTLQAATMMDSNSVNVNPGYYSATDLHATNPAIANGGTPYGNVTTDIDGDLRSTISPSIGADEFTPQQWDAAVVAFNTPKGTYAAQGTSQTVYARIRNFGTDTITSVNVGYVYASGTPVSQTWTGVLLPGDTASILFTTGFTTLIGTETLTAYTMLLLDGDATNDTLSMTFAGLPMLAPTFCDDFDGQNIWATPGTEWQHGVPQGTTINTAHSTPNVWMTKLSGDYSSNANEYLLSPFFDFSNVLTGSTMKFWRNNKFGSSDGFNIEYSNDGGNSWVLLGYMGDTSATNWYTGQVGGTHMFMNSSSGWVQSTYNLAQFNQVTTPIQFRFHLISNASGTDEGAAIDDFCIELPPIPNDVGVISIDSPIDSTMIGATYNVTITVKNFGTASQTSIPVHYIINAQTPLSDNVSIPGGLAPDSTVQFTFSQQFTGLGSDYVLCAYTSLAGDIYTSNDETCESIRATAAALDVGVSLLISPKDTTPYGANVVTVRIKNYGTAPLTSCDVKYYVNSPTNSVTETWTGAALNMGDSVDFTFTQTYNAPVGYYQVCGLTMLTGDADATNDKTCKTVLSSGFDELTENGMKLWQNIPNPANGQTIVEYEIPSSGKIRFEMVDVIGQSIMLVEEDATAGRHKISINADKLAAGIYYYTLEFDGYRLTKKMIVNR
ncbi:MAG: hypothetical protein DRI84_01780, partial [Bacteroidetes bacterium]